MQDVANRCTAKSVDGLVSISHNAEFGRRSALFDRTGQFAHQDVLGVICILILIDQNIGEAAVIVGQYVVMGAENLDHLQEQIAEIDGKLQGLQKQLVPPDQVANLLEGVLTRERGLALVSLRKLPVQQFEAGAAAPKGDAKGVPANMRSIYQHSFEIEIEGSYGELHGYLAHLEKLPWQLFWGKATLDAAKHPRLKLTLTVHTLSMNKVWLVV